MELRLKVLNVSNMREKLKNKIFVQTIAYTIII